MKHKIVWLFSWILHARLSFNNPNALKEICRKGPDGKVESERAIKVKLKSSIATAK